MSFFFLFRPDSYEWLPAPVSGAPRKRKLTKKELDALRLRRARERKEEEEFLFFLLVGIDDG